MKSINASSEVINKLKEQPITIHKIILVVLIIVGLSICSFTEIKFQGNNENG